MRNVSGTPLLFAILTGLMLTSCNVVKEASQSILNLTRCSFKLDGISNFRLAGVLLYGKTSLDVNDATQALTEFAQGEFPVSFILNVAVKNPDGGAAATTSSNTMLTSLAWTLLIDDVPTIEGDIPQPVTIPGSGQQAIVPVWMKFDLLRFFKDKGFEKLVALAFELGGAHGSANRVTLRAKPTIKTSLGDFVYPGEIEIVAKEFRGSEGG